MLEIQLESLSISSVYFFFLWKTQFYLSSQYWDKENFRSRHKRVSAFRFRILSPLLVRTPVPYHSILNSWKYDVALWIYTRCCLRWRNVLRNHHRFLQPHNDVLQDVDEIYSEKCSWKFTLYLENLERYLHKGILKTKYSEHALTTRMWTGTTIGSNGLYGRTDRYFLFPSFLGIDSCLPKHCRCRCYWWHSSHTHTHTHTHTHRGGLLWTSNRPVENTSS